MKSIEQDFNYGLVYEKGNEHFWEDELHLFIRIVSEYYGEIFYVLDSEYYRADDKIKISFKKLKHIEQNGDRVL